MTKSRDTADILEDVKVDGNVTAVGQETLKDNTGAHNTGVGYRAMFNSSLSGSSNVALGNYNLYANTSGSSNTALGYQSLFSNSTASNNTAVGYQSLYANTTGSENVAVGQAALDANTTGSSNTALGRSTLSAATTASGNTAVGESAMRFNTTGTQNVAVGANALDSNTTASGNTAVGYDAASAITTGVYNTCIGIDAGKSITTADSNTMVGRFSGVNTTGTANTFIGKNCGYTVTTGAKNTIIGQYNGNQGGLDIRTASNNIVLSDGDGNPRMRFDSSGAFYIGKVAESATTAGWQFKPTGEAIVGRVANDDIFVFQNSTTGGTVGKISITGSSTSYNTSSDHRLKENVSYTWDATTRLKQLKPARFNFIADADTTVDGFLAHEAQAVVPEAVTGTHNAVDADGNPEYQGIDQSKLVPLLVKTIQELEARITALEA